MNSVWSFRLSAQLALRLPPSWSYALAEKIAISYGMTKRKERDAIKENLCHIMGREISQEQMRRLAGEVYGHFGKYLVDFFRIPKIDDDYIRKKVSLRGVEKLDRFLQQKRGCILLTAHLGSWELGGALLARMGYPIEVIALPHKNQEVNEFFLNRRLSKGVRTIPLASALKGSLSALKQNHFIAILGDRDYTGQGIPARFFGKEVSFPRGAAYLSLKTGAPVLPLFVIRKESDHLELLCGEWIDSPVSQDASDEEIASLTQHFAKILESYIRLYPTQWLVFRKFWEPIHE